MPPAGNPSALAQDCSSLPGKASASSWAAASTCTCPNRSSDSSPGNTADDDIWFPSRPLANACARAGPVRGKGLNTARDARINLLGIVATGTLICGDNWRCVSHGRTAAIRCRGKVPTRQPQACRPTAARCRLSQVQHAAELCGWRRSSTLPRVASSGLDALHLARGHARGLVQSPGYELAMGRCSRTAELQARFVLQLFLMT